MSDQDRECTLDTCPVSESIYGYVPSLGWNVFPLAVAACCTLLQVGMGIKWRTWSYMVAVSIGCFLEAIGYGGRVQLRDDVFDDSAFKLQIVGLTLAPAFLAAGLYLNLKHLVIVFNSKISLLKPHFYTWIFIACDILSIAMQGIGGGLAAADFDPIETANNVMIAGLAFQTFTMMTFGLFSMEYGHRAYRNKHVLNPNTVSLRHSLKFKLFIGSIFLAWLVIFIRCAYRIAEMAGGWQNPIMQNEAEFIGLDTVMCVIAMIAMTAFHPGYCFRQGRVKEGDEKNPDAGDINSGSERPTEMDTVASAK